MRVELRMPASVLDALDTLCRRAEPNEEGAFVLLGQAQTGDSLRLCVRELVPPPRSGLRLQEEGRLAPSTAWMSAMIGRAEREGLGLGFIHSHPGDIGGPGFSGADEWMHETLVPCMLENLPGKAFASLVYHKRGLRGSAWIDDARYEFERVWAIGARLRELTGHERAHPESAEADERHVKLWGAAGQARLKTLTVGVVGSGGTGSVAIDQLARLGVGTIIIADPDSLSSSNVTRVIGSTLGDVGTTKVAVVGAHARRIRGTTIEELPFGIERGEAIERLRLCDVLFGCTDNHASRAILNDLAYQYLIPTIDMGCRIGQLRERTDGIACEVRLLVPDAACLWCAADIDARTIYEERLDPRERARLAREGYVQGLREEPSIVPVTTITASLGVLRFLDVVHGLLEWPDGSFIADVHRLGFMERVIARDPSCLCAERLGVADMRPVA